MQQSQEGHQNAKGPGHRLLDAPALCSPCTVETKIIADPEKCFQELISEKLLIFLRDGPCLELIIVSSNFQALPLLQDKLLESV